MKTPLALCLIVAGCAMFASTSARAQDATTTTTTTTVHHHRHHHRMHHRMHHHMHTTSGAQKPAAEKPAA